MRETRRSKYLCLFMTKGRNIEKESIKIEEEGAIPSVIDENEESKSRKETKNNRYHTKRKSCSLVKVEEKKEAIV